MSHMCCSLKDYEKGAVHFQGSLTQKLEFEILWPIFYLDCRYLISLWTKMVFHLACLLQNHRII